MKNLEIKQLMHDISVLKEKFRYYQNCQEIARYNYKVWDPYDGLTEEQHKNYYANEIAVNRYVLNLMAKKIKECRKELKRVNREQNEKGEA